MKLKIVGSSSSGNCTYIFNEDTHILIDAGISAKKTIEITGRNQFDALFISHQHSDHISGVGPLLKKAEITEIYVDPLIIENKLSLLKDNPKLRTPLVSVPIIVGSITVTPFSTKHDTWSCFGFIIKDRNTSLGFLTDTGSLSKVILQALENCNSLFLEADYDEQLLQDYEYYDEILKNRIRSNFGHLSNQQVIEYLQSIDLDSKKVIILGHLSPRTNTPETLEGHLKTAFAHRQFIIAREGLEVEL